MAHFCENCGRDFSNPRCPRCGAPPSRRDEDIRPTHEPRPLSVPDDSLDNMIEAASRPTLASLLKRGIEHGLIKPAHEYDSGNKP